MKPMLFFANKLFYAYILFIPLIFPLAVLSQSKTNFYTILPEKDGIYYYVSATNGVDKFPGGTITTPFKTLQFVKNFIRSSRWQFKRHVIIFLREGIYELNEPLVFTTDDDSYGQTRITYAAYPGERVIISGGIRLKPKWDTRENRTYYLAFNNQRIKDVHQLLINGKAQPMARYPNSDTLNSTIERLTVDNDYQFTDTTMRISNGHTPFKKWLNAGSGILNITDKSGNANLIYQINDFNSEKKTYMLGRGGFQSMNSDWGVGSTYFVENIAEELDMPGEWHYNATAKMLSYLPPANIDMNTATTDVPVLSSLIQIRGTDKDPVRNLAFVGIEFYATAPNYFDTFEQIGTSNWATTRSAAFQIEGAEQIIIANCRFQSIGGNAILMENYNRRHTIFGNDFQEVGNNAIYLAGNSRQLAGTQKNYPADISIINNRMSYVGKKIHQSAGIIVSTAKNILIQNNYFHHLSAAAICFADGMLGDHQVVSNHITDFGISVQRKAALIAYANEQLCTSMIQPTAHFAHIEDNLITNTATGNAFAIQLMEGTQRVSVKGNQFQRAGIELASGKKRQVTNNIWLGRSELHLWAGSDSLAADDFSMNIISDNAAGRTFAYFLHSISLQNSTFIKIYNNIWHLNDKLPIQRRSLSGNTQDVLFAEWQQRYETGSLFTDPQLNASGNITEASPGFRLGIRPLKTMQAGIIQGQFLY
jgi:hypothetical protein